MLHTLTEIGRIPGTQKNSPIVWVCLLIQVSENFKSATFFATDLDCVDDVGKLIHSLPSVVCVHVGVLCSKVPPLEPVNRTKVALFTGKADKNQAFLGLIIPMSKSDLREKLF